MARGKPLVATDLGESSEIVKHGVNGYLVSPGKVDDMTGKILKLLKEPQEATDMGQRARADSMQYSVDACARTLEKLYTELAERNEYLRVSSKRGLA
jgi:glycosyltransferase involved in cell wall biosynthesis